MFTNDPIADFHRYDAEREERLEELPECDYCGHKIQDDYYFDIDGEILCEKCLCKNYRKNTEDFIR